MRRCTSGCADSQAGSTSKACGKRGQGFLCSVLRINRLGIGHGTGDPGGKAKAVGELRRSGIENRDFAAAACESTSAQIDDKRPIGKDHRVAWAKDIDHDEAGKRFSKRLGEEPSECGGRCCTGLSSGDAGDGNVGVDAGVEDIDCVFAKAHG